MEYTIKLIIFEPDRTFVISHWISNEQIIVMKIKKIAIDTDEINYEFLMNL